MSRTGSILLVTLAAAAGWVGAPAGIAVLSAQTSFGTSQPKAQPSMQKVQPSPKKMQFDQARSRAMAGKPPGGNPGGESNTFMERLKKQHESMFGDGFPGGRLKLDLEGTLPMGILARVPMKQGVPDIPTAKLQVVRGSKFSNQMDVGGFRATREVRPLLPGDVDVTCYHPRAQAECTLASTSGGSFAAKHAITTRGWEALDLDCEDVLDLAKADTAKDETDTYTVKSLMNGWVLGGYSWSWRPEDEGYVMTPVGFAQGSKSSTIKMKWGLYANYCRGPRDSDVRYRVDLYAVGPRGVPHNLPYK